MVLCWRYFCEVYISGASLSSLCWFYAPLFWILILFLIPFYTYQNLDVNSQQLFAANLSDFRATYQFNQRQFLRLILVYSDIERNQQNYTFDVDASSKGLGTQLLYSYKLNPLTKFFVGYSDSAYEDDVLTSLTKNERSVFMKFSYAWLN